MNRTFAIAVLGVTPFVGCGGSGSVSYGKPEQPTSSQMQAVSTMGDIGTNVSTSIKGMSDAAGAFSVHSMMASLQGTAISSSSFSAKAILRSPGALDIDASCTSGSASTGFTYNNCTITDGTVNGSVKITGGTVEYDKLTIKTTSGGTNTQLILDGSVTLDANRLVGHLQYKIHLDVGSIAGFGTNTDVTTDVDFDAGFTTNPACFNDGTIEVKVDQVGTHHGAKFTFTGCNTGTVQNG